MQAWRSGQLIENTFSSTSIKANHQLLHKPTSVCITSQIVDVPKKYTEKKIICYLEPSKLDMDGLDFDTNLPVVIPNQSKLKTR